MFYKFDKETLKFVKVEWISYVLKGLVGVLILSVMLSWTLKIDNKEDYTEQDILVINSRLNSFSEEKLIHLIKNRNFKFPYIVLSQSKLESSYFTSPIFKENHNLFGLKQATKRITSSKGTENGHAYYDNWMASVEDYGYYYAAYLQRIETEDEYIEYLCQNYAEDPQYGSKLRNLIKKEKENKTFE